MKFSYSLLKRFVPGLRSARQAAELLTMGLFEIESVVRDTLDVKVLPNRFSDAASHRGLARELAVLSGTGFREPTVRAVPLGRVARPMRVSIEASDLCLRMSARVFEGVVASGPSPKWVQKTLLSCGMRPNGALVDITNYVTLETGQPLHAFDLDKMEGKILFVRRAKRGEMVELLDGARVALSPDMAVLADASGPLDLAGVRGGRRAEIGPRTKNILLTAGTFDGAAVYRTARAAGVQTDASLRFSHKISPALVPIGIDRASELIAELCSLSARAGGVAGPIVDAYPKKQRERAVPFDAARMNRLLGADIPASAAIGILKKLGFVPRGNRVAVPALRTDISCFPDLVEEVARVYGYGRIVAKAPEVALRAAEHDDTVLLKERARRFFTAAGFDEVYTSSFASVGSVALANPMAEDKAYLRPSLLPLMKKSAESNRRFLDAFRIFEVGAVFRPEERLMLGCAVAGSGRGVFFGLKGALLDFLESFDLSGVSMIPAGQNRNQLQIMTGGRLCGVVRYEGGGLAVGEIDLSLLLRHAEEEFEFTPLPKYPAVVRDASFLVGADVRIGEMIETAQAIDAHVVRDVDLTDEYADPSWQGKQSVTLRIVFQADDRTLTGGEVDALLSKIVAMLGERFGAEVR